MIVTQKIQMDLTKQGEMPIIPAVQGDSDTRLLKIALTTGGTDWEVPEGTTVRIRYCKPDGTGDVYDTMPDGTLAWRVSSNMLLVKLAPQMLTEHGSVLAQVELNRGESCIATFTIQILVQRNPAITAEPEKEGRIGLVPIPKGNDGSFLRVVDGLAVWSVLPGAEAKENVKDFGAVGDGAADDTAAFAAAVAACPEGGVVYVPPGTYMVSDVALKSNMTLEGAGSSSVIKMVSNQPSNACNCVTVNNVSGVVIRNIALDGNRTNNASSGNSHDSGWNCIHISGSQNVLVDNVVAHSAGYHGCIMVAASDIEVRNSVFYDNGFRSIHGHNTVNRVKLWGNECYQNGNGFDGNGSTGVRYDGLYFFGDVHDLDIENNYIHDCATLGGIIIGGNVLQDSAPSDNIRITGNRIVNPSTVYGIHIMGDGISNVAITGNTITGKDGIFMSSTEVQNAVNRDILISGNTIINCGQFGIRSMHDYANVIIADNLLNTAAQFGIYLTNAERVQIARNNIVDFQFGIDLDACADVDVVSNIVEDRSGVCICAMRGKATSSKVRMIYNLTTLSVNNNSTDGVTV